MIATITTSSNAGYVVPFAPTSAAINTPPASPLETTTITARSGEFWVQPTVRRASWV
jgi:hypothetical protein